MPAFVTYVARVGDNGKTPLLELEADGKLLASDRPGYASPVTLPELAVEEEFWAPLNHAMALYGRVEIVRDDPLDDCLFWCIHQGVIQIRAYGTILQQDVRHINSPSDPFTPEIGGEG